MAGATAEIAGVGRVGAILSEENGTVGFAALIVAAGRGQAIRQTQATPACTACIEATLQTSRAGV